MKLEKAILTMLGVVVASFAGAWIETCHNMSTMIG